MNLVRISQYSYLPPLPKDADNQIRFTVENEKTSLSSFDDGEIIETDHLKLMNDGTCFALFDDTAMALPEGVSDETDKFIAYRPALLNGRVFRVVPKPSNEFPSGGLYWVFDSDSPRWKLEWFTETMKVPLYDLEFITAVKRLQSRPHMSADSQSIQYLY